MPGTDGAAHLRFVLHARAHERDRLAGNAFDPPDHGRARVGEIVDDDDVVAGGEELDAGVRADVTGAAGDEHSHCRLVAPADQVPGRRSWS